MEYNGTALELRQKSAMASLIKDALAAKAIRPYEESTSRKFMKYVPIWV